MTKIDQLHEIERIFADEYVVGPGVIGSQAIVRMWGEYSSNSYDPDIVAGATREDLARILLRLTAQIVALGNADKMRNSLGEWVELELAK